ncbi:chemotaxis response regulator protein-glutamate methylesterase [Desulfobacula sp.]|uniref:protein-glutamate methylesterase/protein-glutamine glutaminase n=1 Tax=Desulfobacula sp. TaxID=2593537 RepID=UPI0026130F79|nr:chemotaxis response regulator protein-glutamate methylesterase [Desulfobacula sp.]
MAPIRALVVDDTIVYRKIVGDILKAIPGVEVVGTANNGRIALSKMAALKPDLITLDIEMPEMNGIQVLQALKDHAHAPVVIMLSSRTHQGSKMTIKALELGAFDFVPKPDGGGMAENMQTVNAALVPIIDALKRQKTARVNRFEKPSPLPPAHRVSSLKQPPRQLHPPVIRSGSDIIGIGISTGGPNALTRMIPMLPGDLKVPVLIVQHMPPLFTASLANSLNNKSPLEIKEAESGDLLVAGRIFIAPGGRQMKVVTRADGVTKMIKITDDPPENSCKPSVDYLFRSLARQYGGRSTGVIMTGMGSDGLKGLIQMKIKGGFVIAQNQETCTVYGMPKEPVESGVADIVAPLENIAQEILNTIHA